MQTASKKYQKVPGDDRSGHHLDKHISSSELLPRVDRHPNIRNALNSINFGATDELKNLASLWISEL